MQKLFKYYKNLPRYEYKQLRGEISPIEYILWWTVRALMIYALYSSIKNPDRDFLYRLTIFGNLSATFTVLLGRVLFPKFLFLGRLPYSVQRFITFHVLLGSFFGQYVGFYWRIPTYDKWLHLVLGVTGVFIGYHVMMCMKHNNRPVSPFIASFSGFGFSCFLSVAWEIFEFMTDYYIAGSTNQNYRWAPEPDMFFFKIFGLGAQNTGQAALYDTMIDTILGLTGAVIGGIIIWPYVKRHGKKLIEGTKTPDSLRWEEVGATVTA